MERQKVKTSKYNLIVKNGINSFIIHNMLSKNTILINNKELKLLKSLEDPVFNSKMIEYGFLVAENTDETQVALKENVDACNDMSYMNITLIPSFGCNLKCKYCYQNGAKTNKMSEESQEGFIRFIKKRLIDLKCNSLHLSWFGGEPLMFSDIVIKISKTLKNFCEQNFINFSCSISTNLTLFNEELIETFKDINVTRIETTLVGEEKAHNLLRPTANGSNLYLKTFNSILLVAQHFTTMVNINFCKENYFSIKRLIKNLSKQKMDNLYLNFNEIVNYKQNRQQCKQFKNTEKIKLKLFSYALKNKLQICDITNFCGSAMFCPQYHKNSFAVDSELNIYKCTEKCDDSTRFAIIESKTGEMKLLHNNRKNFSDEYKCVNCHFLPYCNGGCTIKRQQKEKPCPSELDSVNKYLKLFVKRESLK